MTQDNGLEGEPTTTFGDELQALINQFSQENGSDTPDFILADYLIDCLVSYRRATRMRDKWYGFEPWASSGRRLDESPVNIDSEVLR